MHRLSRSQARRIVALLAGLASLCARGTTARADDLRVATLDGDSWASAVATLEADVHAEGRTLQIVVDDARGARVACGRYRLLLDHVASSAFVLGSCDASSDATAVTLVHRSALFDESDVVPRALAAGISALEVLHGGEAGGAGVTGGSTLHCTIDVHPYLSDLEHGTHVYLSPGRYALRPTSSAVTATARDDGWTLATTMTGTLTVDYVVVDTRSGEVMLRDRATLSCAGTTSHTPWRGSGASIGVPPSAATTLALGAADDAPSPWVRSQSAPGTLGTEGAAPQRTAEAIAVLVLDASDELSAQRDLRARAAAIGADDIASVTILPTTAGVHATALAVRTVSAP